MGRLPNTYADRPITARDPYAMYGEMALTSAQEAREFPPATFQCGTVRPLELHRLIPRLYALDDDGVLLATQPSQDTLAGLVKISIKITAREQAMTRVPTRISALTKGEAERTWEWADPEYLEKSTGFTVTIEPDTFPTIDDMAAILVCINFEGFMISLDGAINS